MNANLQLPALTVDQLTRELDSVAIDWTSPRGVRECSCTTAFDHFSKKVSEHARPVVLVGRFWT